MLVVLGVLSALTVGYGRCSSLEMEDDVQA